MIEISESDLTLLIGRIEGVKLALEEFDDRFLDLKAHRLGQCMEALIAAADASGNTYFRETFAPDGEGLGIAG